MPFVVVVAMHSANYIMKSCTSHVYKVTTGLWSIQIKMDDKCNIFSKQTPTPSDYNTIWGDISAISKQNVNTLLFRFINNYESMMY